MAHYRIIKLTHLTPLHVGTGRESYDISSVSLESDTLSSALAAINMQCGEERDVEEFMNSFTISSAFPYYQNHFFLPKPLNKLNIEIKNTEEHLYRKKLKKAKFLSTEVWNRLMQGERVVLESEECINGQFILSSVVAKDKNYDSDFKFEQPFVSQVNQRTYVPNDASKKTEPFYFNWTYFHPNAGLYCLVKLKDEADEKTFDYIRQLFELLGNIGLGTDKSVGGGQFEVETDSMELPDVKNPNYQMLLSLYIPQKEELMEIDLNRSSYDLVLRNGYIAGSTKEELRHLRKKSIYMFSTGSLLSAPSELKGKVVNLRPEWKKSELHPIYRSGQPLALPVCLSEKM